MPGNLKLSVTFVLIYLSFSQVSAGNYLPPPNGLYQSTIGMPQMPAPAVSFSQADQEYLKTTETESVEVDGKVYHFPVERRINTSQQSVQRSQTLNPQSNPLFQSGYSQKFQEFQPEVRGKENSYVPEQFFGQSAYSEPEVAEQNHNLGPFQQQYPLHSNSFQPDPRQIPQQQFQRTTPQPNYQLPWQTGRQPQYQSYQNYQGYPAINPYANQQLQNFTGMPSPNPWAIMQSYPAVPNW